MNSLDDVKGLVSDVKSLAEADAPAAAATASKIDTAVGLMQALTASIADLKSKLASGNLVSQADLDAMASALQSAKDALAASKTTETAADTALDAAVTANTPAA